MHGEDDEDGSIMGAVLRRLNSRSFEGWCKGMGRGRWQANQDMGGEEDEGGVTTRTWACRDSTLCIRIKRGPKTKKGRWGMRTDTSTQRYGSPSLHADAHTRSLLMYDCGQRNKSRIAATLEDRARVTAFTYECREVQCCLHASRCACVQGDA